MIEGDDSEEARLRALGVDRQSEVTNLFPPTARSLFESVMMALAGGAVPPSPPQSPSQQGRLAELPVRDVEPSKIAGPSESEVPPSFKKASKETEPVVPPAPSTATAPVSKKRGPKKRAELPPATSSTDVAAEVPKRRRGSAKMQPPAPPVRDAPLKPPGYAAARLHDRSAAETKADIEAVAAVQKLPQRQPSRPSQSAPVIAAAATDQRPPTAPEKPEVAPTRKAPPDDLGPAASRAKRAKAEAASTQKTSLDDHGPAASRAEAEAAPNPISTTSLLKITPDQEETYFKNTWGADKSHERLGAGSFGDVTFAVMKTTGVRVARKVGVFMGSGCTL